MTSAHRYGTCSHADKRVKVHSLGNPDRQQVLDYNQNGHEKDHHDQGTTALFQGFHIGLEAYGGEEKHHADVLYCTVEKELHPEKAVTC